MGDLMVECPKGRAEKAEEVRARAQSKAPRASPRNQAGFDRAQCVRAGVTRDRAVAFQNRKASALPEASSTTL